MRALILGLSVVLSVAGMLAQGSASLAGGDRSTLARLESYRECDFPKLEPRLLISLGHNVEGVVVGALREVAKIKLAQPTCTSERIASKVDDLVREGATPAIRFKAYLTSIVLSNPQTFAHEGEQEYQTDEQFFTAVARRLEELALRDER